MYYLKKYMYHIIIAVVLVAIIVAVSQKNSIKAYSKRKLNEGDEKGKDDTLYKGDSGQAVLELQGLILSVNPDSLPRYGADGVFGNETEVALNEIYGKKSVSLSDFNDFVNPKKEAPVNG